MNERQTDLIRETLNEGELPEIESLERVGDPSDAVAIALGSQVGRRWLRSLRDLDTGLADRLLAIECDFRSTHRDRTLELAVSQASLDALIEHRNAIASGPAASAFWGRLASDHAQLVDTAIAIVTSDDAGAAENTLYLLVLDTLNPWSLETRERALIAQSGLTSNEAAIRSLAAEYLFNNDITSLGELEHALVLDSDERVRGLAWSARFRQSPATTFDAATAILGDESAELPVRRSALAALGTHLPTSDVVDLLTFFVAHPEEQLALDAGNLLHRLHRHPTIATAAAQSPHQSVREIGEFLLDPYRGSPAAGGSRPGDPTTSDIFAEMIRQTESPNPEDRSR